MKSERSASEMWPREQNKSRTAVSGANSTEMAASQLTWTLLNAVQQRNVSTVASPRPSYTEDSVARGNGIIPGAIAAAVFIAFLLALYAVLWKCMVSPPQRKKRKVRGRLQQRAPV